MTLSAGAPLNMGVQSVSTTDEEAGFEASGNEWIGRRVCRWARSHHPTGTSEPLLLSRGRSECRSVV